MRFNYSGMAKMLSWGISFGLAFAMVACDDSSNPAGSSGGEKGKTENGGSTIYVKSNGCDFKKDDKMWEYSYTMTGVGAGDIKKIYIYKEGGSTDSSIVISVLPSGANCSAVGGDYGAGDVSASVWCEGNTMYSSEVSRNVDTELSRDEAFEEVMNACKAANNKLSGSDEDPFEDDGDQGGQSGSTEIDEDLPLTNVSCNFKKEDNVWKVTADEGSATIEWVGNKPVVHAKVDMGDAETCEMMLEFALMDAEDASEASCEGKFLVIKDETEYAGYTRDQLYEEVMEGCRDL